MDKSHVAISNKISGRLPYVYEMLQDRNYKLYVLIRVNSRGLTVTMWNTAFQNGVY
ncbi:MAG: hypothetical protein BroJett041_16920 [Candidatus Jettenia caeni]|nr:MAG: hypothetical protein BroJett041_16920 [Candidatus Jettenia caeni]GJQ45618.1 MAG: hypothetical protein JETCAE04_13720 [Candidatus Jettenia caeni]